MQEQLALKFGQVAFKDLSMSFEVALEEANVLVRSRLLASNFAVENSRAVFS